MKNNLSRRDFVKLGSLFTAALATQPLHALSVSDPWKLKRGKPQKVIILGAGMSGLSAGLELQKLGHDVQIIEGQMRAGGRVFTARNMFADGLHADMGAARIPENHDWTMKYIKQYGLKLIPFNPPENDYLHVINGKKIRYTSKKAAELKEYPVALTPQEFEMGWEGISIKPFAEIMSHLGDPKSMSWPPKEIAGYDSMSFKEFLVSRQFSPAIADVLMLGWEEKTGLSMSILEDVREMGLSFGAPRNKIAGGNDLLPRAIASELGAVIQYGTKVAGIEQDASGVSVTVLRNGEKSTLRADRVICTFSLPVLRKMDFVKTLSKPKQDAINKLDYWNLSRTVVQVRERYWKKDGFNGFVAGDQPIEIWDPHYESDARRGMIAAYIKNHDSQLFLKMNEKERFDFSATQINNVFPGLYEYQEGGYTKCWGDDPWAGGAHALTSRNQITQLLPHLIGPEGRIHFAGEHASAYHGWIQGAIESGNRAAKEINSFD
jgi:monoamine oxidase